MEAIFLVNTKGDFAYANEAASKVYGYSLDEFLNMNIAPYCSQRTPPQLKRLLSHIVEKGQTSLRNGSPAERWSPNARKTIL